MPFFADPSRDAEAAQILLLRAATILYGLSALLALCSIGQQHSRFHVDTIVGVFLATVSGLWGGTLLLQALIPVPERLDTADNPFSALAIFAGLLHVAFASAAFAGIKTRKPWWPRLARQGATGLIASSAALLLLLCLPIFLAQDAKPIGDWKLAAIMMALGIAVALLGWARAKIRRRNQSGSTP